MPILNSKILGETGLDLLILHGFLGMGDNWKTHAKNWSTNGFRVHLIDQRNHGRSFWDDAFSYKLMAEDIVDYCKSHDLKNILVLGHSMGGKTVMHLACNNPELIKAFVVADISPKRYKPGHKQILIGLSRLDFKQIRNRLDADLQLTNYVSDVGTRMFLLKNLYWVEKDKLGLRLNIDILKNANESVGEGLSSEMQSDLPCLFLKGSNSEYIFETDTPLIHYHFPKAEQFTIPDSGHWLHAENPKLFFKVVTKWLQKQF
jgi:pimeloyl-ACP methyl ester carboxylesterase